MYLYADKVFRKYFFLFLTLLVAGIIIQHAQHYLQGVLDPDISIRNGLFALQYGILITSIAYGIRTGSVPVPQTEQNLSSRHKFWAGLFVTLLYIALVNPYNLSKIWIYPYPNLFIDQETEKLMFQVLVISLYYFWLSIVTTLLYFFAFKIEYRLPTLILSTVVIYLMEYNGLYWNVPTCFDDNIYIVQLNCLSLATFICIGILIIRYIIWLRRGDIPMAKRHVIAIIILAALPILASIYRDAKLYVF